MTQFKSGDLVRVTGDEIYYKNAEGYSWLAKVPALKMLDLVGEVSYVEEIEVESDEFNNFKSVNVYWIKFRETGNREIVQAFIEDSLEKADGFLDQQVRLRYSDNSAKELPSGKKSLAALDLDQDFTFGAGL